jgi:hypothetical protein
VFSWQRITLSVSELRPPCNSCHQRNNHRHLRRFQPFDSTRNIFFHHRCTDSFPSDLYRTILGSVCSGFKVLDIPSRTSLQLSSAFRLGSMFPAFPFLTEIVLSTSTRITRSICSCALRSDISFGASDMLLMRLMSADVVFTAMEATPTAPDVTPNISAILIGAGLRCV